MGKHEATNEAAWRATARFAFDGEPVAVVRLPGGHINDSYRVNIARDGSHAGYLMQRINTAVFRAPSVLMENIARVTRHIADRCSATGGSDPHRRTLNIIPTRTAGLYWRDEQGGAWRAYDFIPRTVTRHTVTSAAEAESVGRAFGLFQALLSDLPAPPLHETITGFHDTAARLAALRAAASADPCGRRAACEAELAAVEQHARLAEALTGAQRPSTLPIRAVHNDAKINNVLFDEVSGEALCVIDLDTVMPGLAAHDFGDMVRSMASSAAEDETDLARVVVEHEHLEALTRGYLSAAGDFLTAAERQSLSVAGVVITFEQAVRFLTDHLNGDVYYRVSRAGHNLDRARNQVALLEALLAAMPTRPMR